MENGIFVIILYYMCLLEKSMLIYRKKYCLIYIIALLNGNSSVLYRADILVIL